MDEEKDPKKALYHHLKIDEYTPDAKKINMALWGKETPPSAADMEKERWELNNLIAKMRNREPRG